MLVDELRLVMTDASLESLDLNALDELLLDAKIDEPAEWGPVRLVRFSCIPMINEVPSGRIRADYEIVLHQDASSTGIDERLVDVAWPYFRQHILSLAPGFSQAVRVPVHSPFPASKDTHQDATAAGDFLGPPARRRPWEQRWAGDIVPRLSIFATVGRVMSEVIERTSAWLGTPMRLFTYLALTETEELFTLGFRAEVETDEALSSLQEEFGFTVEEWLSLDVADRALLVKLSEDLLKIVFDSVVLDDADPDSSVIPDEFMDGATDVLNYVVQASSQIPQVAQELSDTLLSEILETVGAGIERDSLPDYLAAKTYVRYGAGIGFEMTVCTMGVHDGERSGLLSYGRRVSKQAGPILLFHIAGL